MLVQPLARHLEVISGACLQLPYVAPMCKQKFPIPSVAVFRRCAICFADECFSDGDLDSEVKTSERRSVWLRRQASRRSSRGEAPCASTSACLCNSKIPERSALNARHLHTSSPILSLCSGSAGTSSDSHNRELENLDANAGALEEDLNL